MVANKLLNVKFLFAILLIFGSLGQVTSDLYLPSLPFIKHALSATVNLTQLSVALYMLGFSISQLVYGPLSDGIGRRIPLIVGLSICLLGSIGCAFANSVHMLIFNRFLQGLGAGAGMSLSRSILRDLFGGVELAKLGSYLSFGNITIMASAPLLGGYIQHFFNWRANFMLLTIYATIALLSAVFLLPETNKHKQIKKLKPAILRQSVTALLSSPIFMGYGLCIFLTYAGILAWITEGPILLQDMVGLSPVEFGWMTAIVGASYAIGCIVNGNLIKKFGIENMVKRGLYVMFLAGIVMLLPVLTHIINAFVIVMPVAMFLFGASLVFPNAFAGAFSPFPKIAGIAAALFGFMQILGGAISSGVISYLPDKTQMPLTLTFIICATIAILLNRSVIRRKVT